MTGTSIDGLDVALVAIQGRGLAMTAQAVRCLSRPLGPLVEPLRRLASQTPMSAGDIARLSRDLSLLHADVLRELMGDEKCDLIAVHGQTVFHAPPASWQMIAAAPIAHALGAPVVFDMRAADLAAGGQGAPITPLADYVLFRHPRERRTIVNLGGFSNYTSLPPAPGRSPQRRAAELSAIRGGDICACNQLLDTLARTTFGEPFDEGGKRALAGTACPEVRDALAAELRAQGRSGRSLGTGDELVELLSRLRGRCPGEDFARSACEAIAQVAVARIGVTDRVLLAGGGARNQALFAAIAAFATAPVQLTDVCGVPAHYREAIAMAVLGALCQDRVPITLPQITSLSQPAPLAGSWASAQSQRGWLGERPSGRSERLTRAPGGPTSGRSVDRPEACPPGF